MNLSHLPAAAALLTTIALSLILFTRSPGANDQTGVYIEAIFAFGIVWLLTLIVLVILVYKGAFDWIPNGTLLRYSTVMALHLIGGCVGLLGVFGVRAFGLVEWWVLPCAAFATVLPLLVQAAALNGSFRAGLVAVIALQAAAIVLVPAGYVVREVMKERAHAAYNVNWSDALHERSNNIPANASIDQYFPFVIEPRHIGIAEHAARQLARRDNHEAMLVEALGGPDRYEALSLLAIDGVVPTAALADAVRDAIATVASDRECKTAVEVAGRFEAYAASLIPAMKKLSEGACLSPKDRSLNKWLRKHESHPNPVK